MNNPQEVRGYADYYPFGLAHKGYNSFVNSTNAAEKFRYNGKEHNEELGLEWYDYGARNYVASLGRWMNIDPLAEKYYGVSAFNYAVNLPLIFVDPDGKELLFTFDGMSKSEKRKAMEFLERFLNKGFEGYATASINKKGKLSITKNE